MCSKKKILAVFAIAFCGVSAFGVDGSIIDGSAVISSLAYMNADLSKWVSDALPLVAVIIGGFMLFCMLCFGVSSLKSFSGTAAVAEGKKSNRKPKNKGCCK